MNGLDAVVFHRRHRRALPDLRREPRHRILGIRLNEEKNAAAAATRGCWPPWEVWVIPTNEELMIRRNTYTIYSPSRNKPISKERRGQKKPRHSLIVPEAGGPRAASVGALPPPSRRSTAARGAACSGFCSARVSASTRFAARCASATSLHVGREVRDAQLRQTVLLLCKENTVQ